MLRYRHVSIASASIRRFGNFHNGEWLERSYVTCHLLTTSTTLLLNSKWFIYVLTADSKGTSWATMLRRDSNAGLTQGLGQPLVGFNVSKAMD